MPTSTSLQLKITLLGVTKPPVWRRLRVPAATPLDQFHAVVQVAMGWHDCHLHAFRSAGTTYGPAGFDLDMDDEAAARLQDVAGSVGDRLVYEYDFGDGWEHEILVEEVLEVDRDHLLCVAGRGACPPEDCGGVWGYADLRQALADPAHEQHEEMLEWLELESPSAFDATRFDINAVNARLTRGASSNPF